MTGNANPSFDFRIAEWLEEGPDDAPAVVLDTVLAATPLIPQRRELLAPRRLPSMFRIAALAAAIVAVVVGGILMAGGGRGLVPVANPTFAAPTAAPVTIPATAVSAAPKATGTTAPGPTMPPPSATFTSPWYGYTVAYPGGWQVKPGTGPWPPNQNLLHGDPHLDEIRGPIGSLEARIVGASIALPVGMGLDGFMAFASSGSCDALDPLQEPLRINGLQATVTLNGCESQSELGGLIWDVVVVAGGRGYDFTIDGALTSREAQAWLDSIWLLPTAARS